MHGASYSSFRLERPQLELQVNTLTALYDMNSHVIHIIHWLVSALALLIVAYLVKGFKIKNFAVALIAAIIIGFANAIIWPVLIFLTLPINILTLGLFTFVVNGAVLKICAAVIPGFEIDGWIAAIFGSILLSLVGSGLHILLI